MDEQILETIDGNIKDIILELNKKGYKTMFSCGGHVGKECTEIYVVIQRNSTLDIILDNLDTSIFSSLPKEFKLELQDGYETYETLKKTTNPTWVEQFEPQFFHRMVIRTHRDISHMMTYEQEVIDNCISELTQFVDKLPYM